jgi:hypothetical protein
MKLRWRSGGLLLALLQCLAGTGRSDDALPSGWECVPAETATLADPGERAVHISARFLGTPYQANTLGGGNELPEVLTVRFDAVDCFTLLDYVEALRRSANAGEFRARLIEVRYRDEVIGWRSRRHFFTDWAAAPGGRVVDVTAEVGGSSTRQTVKQLNLGTNGTLLLPGVAVQERLIYFVPPAALDSQVLGRLRPGDYVGIYTPRPGLDVTHVGLVVRRGHQLYLRHASSRREAGKVIDSDFLAYLANKPGIVVLRPVQP